MKRSELAVGAELAYFSSTNHWLDKPAKAVVLAIEPHTRSHSFRREITQTNSGQGVLVQRYNAWNKDDTGQKTVVQLRQLEDDYATALKVYEERLAVREAQRLADNRIKEENAKFQNEVVKPALEDLALALSTIKGDSPTKFFGGKELQYLDVEIIKAITDAVNDKYKVVNSVSKEWT